MHAAQRRQQGRWARQGARQWARQWARGGLAVGLLLVGAAGCRTPGGAARGEPPAARVDFPPEVVVSDQQLRALNDEELFAQGTAAAGAQEHAQAARLFGWLADHHPGSRHRPAALLGAGLAHERQEQWEPALARYAALSEPARGEGEALEASFREATMLYMLGRHDDAAALLTLLWGREDLPPGRRMQALVERGVCEKERGDLAASEATLRRALAFHEALEDPDAVDPFLPSQAQFHLAEVYRLHSEAVALDPARGVEQLTRDLDYKAELLLSAQGHYLRCIRLGHGEWATAAGAQVGGLYEGLWEHMSRTPVPAGLDAAQAELYRRELRKKIRVLLSKAISVYERTLETAVRIGAQNTYVDRTRESLQRMKEQLLVEARADEEAAEAAEAEAAEGEAVEAAEEAPEPAPRPPPRRPRTARPRPRS
jgi:tetratricopeptide (TPR) repeat protein